MGLAHGDRVFFDFRSLDETQQRLIPPLILSIDALYDVIQGQSLSFSLEGSVLTLRSSGDELLILCTCNGSPEIRRYRVWLAEIALGWNMLRGFTASSIGLY